MPGPNVKRSSEIVRSASYSRVTRRSTACPAKGVSSSTSSVTSTAPDVGGSTARTCAERERYSRPSTSSASGGIRKTPGRVATISYVRIARTSSRRSTPPGVITTELERCAFWAPARDRRPSTSGKSGRSASGAPSTISRA